MAQWLREALCWLKTGHFVTEHATRWNPLTGVPYMGTRCHRCKRWVK